jgi:hypothetical protein
MASVFMVKSVEKAGGRSEQNARTEPAEWGRSKTSFYFLRIIFLGLSVNRRNWRKVRPDFRMTDEIEVQESVPLNLKSVI